MILDGRVVSVSTYGVSAGGVACLSKGVDFGAALDSIADQYVLGSPGVLAALRRGNPSHPLLTGDSETLGGVLRSLRDAKVGPSRRAKLLSGLASGGLVLSPAVASGLIVYQQTGNWVLSAVVAGGAVVGAVEVSNWMYPLLQNWLDSRFFQRVGSPEERVMEYVAEMGGSLGLIESDPRLFGDFLETGVMEMFRGEEGKARGRKESLTAQVERLRLSIQEQISAIEAQALEAEMRNPLLARLEQAQREMEDLITEEVQKEEAIIKSIQEFLGGIRTMQNDLRQETRAMALSEAVAGIEAAVDRLRADTERREVARIKSVVSMAAYVARLTKMGEDLTILLAARREVEGLLLLPKPV